MYSRALYTNSNYPYYHELQLPMINDYYYSKSSTAVAPPGVQQAASGSTGNLLIHEVKVLRPKSTHRAIISEEQIDLNALYKFSNRRKRTSYNANFHVSSFNVNERPKTPVKPLPMLEQQPQLQESDDNFQSSSLYSNYNKRNSFFTQTTDKNATNSYLSNRKSFWRPKTPCISLDMRRKDSRNNLPQDILQEQKLTTVSKFENISKRTGDLIDRFRSKYENNS